MKNKTIIAIVVLCCSLSSSKGQTNNIYAEFLGVGLLASLNYERMVKANIYARVSYGGFSVTDEGSDDYKKQVTRIEELETKVHEFDELQTKVEDLESHVSEALESDKDEIRETVQEVISGGTFTFDY